MPDSNPKIDMIHCTELKLGDLVVLRSENTDALSTGIVTYLREPFDKVRRDFQENGLRMRHESIVLLVPEGFDMSNSFPPLFGKYIKNKQTCYRQVKYVSMHRKSTYEVGYYLTEGDFNYYYVECFHVDP
jgi:hypothetical protein